MDAPRHYVCRVKLDGRESFVIWTSAERDEFVRDEAGRLLMASSSEELADATEARGINLEADEPAVYDFDHIQKWCAAPDAEGVDCPAFLNAWNFLDDLAGLYSGSDSPYTRVSRAASGRRETLFWGCNLPSVTPPGERFVPTWTAEGISEMRDVLAEGLALLRAEIDFAREKGAL